MTAGTGIITEIARAKVNLTLHVGKTISDGIFKGYHPVDSLVVFADFGDVITVESAKVAGFEISGPFAPGLEANSDNLVVRALNLAKTPPKKVFLEKHIPVAAGLGGGSANAAAILRRFDPQKLVNDVQLGADVPVCRISRTSWMQGVGEKVQPIANLGQTPALLVNPLIAVSTGAVFKAFDSKDREEFPAENVTKGSLLERAIRGRNDLQPVAIETAPIIKSVITEIQAQKGCQLARMSGSGASCFGLFGSLEEANAATDAIKTSHPDWWVRACQIGDLDE